MEISKGYFTSAFRNTRDDINHFKSTLEQTLNNQKQIPADKSIILKIGLIAYHNESKVKLTPQGDLTDWSSESIVNE